MKVVTCIEDLRVLAEKRVPKMFYQYADSGSWSETTYRENEADLARIRFRQRVGVSRGCCDTAEGQRVGVSRACCDSAGGQRC